MKIYIFIILLGIIFGCTQDDFENAELNNSEFQPYLNSFLEEARIRGHNFTNNNNIKFYFADIENHAGICYQKNEEIIIDRGTWEISSEINRELLIFHELGHCIIGRAHRNENSISGECLSLMRGDENGFNCSRNIHSTFWREYYLDELFNKNTVLPNWYTDNQEYAITYTNPLDIVSISDLNTDFYSTSFEFNNKEKFVIEFTFKNWDTVSSNLNSIIAQVVSGGIFYGSTPLSEKDQIFISGEAGSYFIHNDYKFNNNIKLTIRKNNNLLQFFIDEQFMHVMEVESFKNNIIQASFNEPINMDIKIFEYD
ncbi:MAG: hypothetical protein ABJL44_14600 [Algibacter sp.]